jgi:hypothetical protein
MEYNIHFLKPKYGLILDVRHIVFNITTIKILFSFTSAASHSMHTADSILNKAK